MMQRPWASGTIDEWLPRSLRLCWGGSGDSDGGGMGASTGGGDWGSSGSFSGDSFGSGYSGFADSFGGPASGGGDWGSAAAYDASGMNAATADAYASAMANSPGGFYDTGGPGIAAGALGAEFGGTFGLGGISGNPGDPQGAFGAELDAGGGGLSGVGRAIESWGRDTPATQAGYAGSFADLSGGFGGVGSPGFGGYGGSGSIGSGYGGGFSGGGYSGGGGGGRGGGVSTGGGGTGGGGRGSGGSRGSVSVTSPYADDTGPQGRGESEVTSPYADDTGPTGRGEQDTVEAAPEADTPAPEAGPSFGTPTSSPDTTMESGPAEAPTSTDDTSTLGGDPALSGASVQDAPTAFGPQSLSYDYQGSPSQAYTDATQALSDLTQSALSPQDVNWGSVFEGAAAPQVEPGSRDIFSVSPSSWANVVNLNPIETSKSFWDANSWLSPTTQQTFNEITSIPSAINSFLNPAVPTMLQAPSTMDLQALGEQGRAGQQTDLATQLGTQDIAPGGIDPGAAQYSTAPDPASQLGIENIGGTPDWASVFEGTPTSPDWTSVFEGAAPTAEPDWGSVFEGAAPDPTDWASVFEGTPGDIDWGAVFEGAAPSYDETMDPASQVAAPASTDDATTQGADPALSGEAAADAASTAAEATGAPQAAQDAAAQAAQAAALNGASPTEQAVAAMAAALDKGATQAQADAIGAAVHAAAVANPNTVVSKSAWEALSKDPGAFPAVNLPGVPAVQPSVSPEPDVSPTPDWGSVFEGAAPAPTPAPAPDVAPLGTPQAQPGLADMGGQPGTSATIPGGRTTDFNYPSSTSRGIEPGAEQYGVEADDDHDAPEPGDRSLPAGTDPNADRPPANIPGQLRGANGQYDNPQADTPRGSRTYRDSGRTDYPQGRPGIDFRTARQAGITPLFSTEDINVEDTDARLVENINRALRDMERQTGIPASSLVATSGYRAAHRGEALEHMMDPRTSQESVYSRGHPTSGRGFPSAPPGGSNHGHGRAIDFASSRALTWLRAHAGQYGLGLIGGDHPHIQLQNARGNVGARPSAQEQAEQRALDAQNRQAAADRGLIAPGRGQQAGVPTPRPRPADAPQVETAQPDVPPAPPAVALPPVAPPDVVPAPRPPADVPIDIPVQTPPPAPAPAQTPAQTRAGHIAAAKGIIAEYGKGLEKPGGDREARATAAYNKAGEAMAKAGVPANIARAELLKATEAGAAKAGYTRDMFMIGGQVGAAIDRMVDAAMQAYQAALGKRSEAPGGQQFAGLSQSQPTPSVAQPPIFSIPALQQLSPIIAPPPPPLPPPTIQTQVPNPTRFLAKGGRAAKDEPVVVGEEGPEVFVPDQAGTVLPHMPPGGGGDFGRWPKLPTPDYPGRYAGVGREMKRQMRAAQDPSPGLMDMIDSGRLRLNAANWQRMLNDPVLIALGRSRIEDNRKGIDPGAEQYGAFIPASAPAAGPPDPTSQMAQALGYNSIRRPDPRPLRIGRQSY